MPSYTRGKAGPENEKTPRKRPVASPMGETPARKEAHSPDLGEREASRLRSLSEPARAEAVMELQRRYGNRRLQRMLGQLVRPQTPAASASPATESMARAAETQIQEDPNQVSREVASRIEGQRGSGSPLDAGTQSEMAAAFGQDFGDVRVHTGHEADTLNQEVQARAFTVGKDIFFRGGTFALGSSEGKELLAHELTHVVQQGTAPTSGVVPARTTSPDDTTEIEAAKVAESVVHQGEVARQSEEEEEMAMARQVEEEEEVAMARQAEATPTIPSTTTSTAAATEKPTPVLPDSAKLSGKTWWVANEDKAPLTKSADIKELDAGFKAKVNEFKKALEDAKATISINTTRRSSARAHVFNYAWNVANGKIKASEVPAIVDVDIVWDHGDEKKSKAGAQEILTAAKVADTEPSTTSRHIEGLAIDWTITWTGDLKIKQKDGTVKEIKGEPRNGGDPPGGNKELHAVGLGYGVQKGIFTKKDDPHWSSDGK